MSIDSQRYASGLSTLSVLGLTIYIEFVLFVVSLSHVSITSKSPLTGLSMPTVIGIIDFYRFCSLVFRRCSWALYCSQKGETTMIRKPFGRRFC